jgi:hypothetical protein
MPERKGFARLDRSITKEERRASIGRWLVENGIMPPPEGWLPPEDRDK